MMETNTKIELIKEYLMKRIDAKRTLAEEYRENGSYQMAMVAEAQAAEVDLTLAYLLGVIHEE